MRCAASSTPPTSTCASSAGRSSPPWGCCCCGSWVSSWPGGAFRPRRRSWPATLQRACDHVTDTAEGGVGGAAKGRLTVRQAAFIGVGSMVGAGIFSLLGAAGAVAGAAVWLSFLLAGAGAGLQGYSFAQFGARYPSAGGLLEYVRRGYGDGHTTGIVAWMVLATNAVVTAMVAISFGSYARGAFTSGNGTWVKVFAVLLVVVMSLLNILGSRVVANAQTVVVVVVITSLTIFAVSTLANLHGHLLAPSGYPPAKDIITSVAP